MLTGISTTPKPSLAFFRAKIWLLVIRGKSITPCSFRVHFPMVLSNGSICTSIGTKPSFPSLSYSDPYLVMFNNVDSTNMMTNTNDEKRTIPIEYYTISEIIVLLNTMTDNPFSISTKASSYGCIWIQSPFSIH